MKNPRLIGFLKRCQVLVSIHRIFADARALLYKLDYLSFNSLSTGSTIIRSISRMLSITPGAYRIQYGWRSLR